MMCSRRWPRHPPDAGRRQRSTSRLTHPPARQRLRPSWPRHPLLDAPGRHARPRQDVLTANAGIKMAFAKQLPGRHARTHVGRVQERRRAGRSACGMDVDVAHNTRGARAGPAAFLDDPSASTHLDESADRHGHGSCGDTHGRAQLEQPRSQRSSRTSLARGWTRLLAVGGGQLTRRRDDHGTGRHVIAGRGAGADAAPAAPLDVGALTRLEVLKIDGRARPRWTPRRPCSYPATALLETLGRGAHGSTHPHPQYTADLVQQLFACSVSNQAPPVNSCSAINATSLYRLVEYIHIK
ncbi:hypothetical protein FA95DRAFT_1137122 [Auriscalpium vulgare]|uniref:Uncharacterized protein n=1 Tax=Auriscalpium vulgare TaxID=40419 RepID=A0ACB8R3W4_9AGAM|nr:hypothetical protein FA95DRAFT_1137122 [Auriscalpium vulgare]